MNVPTLQSGFRMFLRHVKVSIFSFKKYEGSPKSICKQIINACWNKKHQYFQVSAGHFKDFYVRDFSWCAKHLMNLGYKEKVHKTLDFALSSYQKYNTITTSISPNKVPFNFPTLSPDSLPSLLRSLQDAKATHLIKKYKTFLNKQILLYEKTFLNKDGLIKSGTFSSIKDHHKRNSSCYDNCMLLMLKNLLKHYPALHNIKTSISKEKITTLFYDKKQKHFKDDLSTSSFLCADANIFPFWTNCFSNTQLLKTTLKKLETSQLVSPFPIKYTNKKPTTKTPLLASFLAPNYEGTTIWAHIGMLYLVLLKKAKHPSFKKHLFTYKELLNKHKTFLEVFEPNGKPYKTLVYTTDEGMLWAAILLNVMD